MLCLKCATSLVHASVPIRVEGLKDGTWCFFGPRFLDTKRVKAMCAPYLVCCRIPCATTPETIRRFMLRFVTLTKTSNKEEESPMQRAGL